MAHLDSDGLLPSPAAVALIPEAIARTLRCVPISATARTLRIAVSTPLSGGQLRSLVDISRRQLISEFEPGPLVVDELIEAAYGDASAAVTPGH